MKNGVEVYGQIKNLKKNCKVGFFKNFLPPGFLIYKNSKNGFQPL